MKILITGGKGRIGSYLLKNNLVGGSIDVDILNQQAISFSIGNKVLKNEAYVVLHMAAETDVSFCEENPKKCFDTNVIGTKNVIEAVEDFSNLGRVLVFSSCHVFNGEAYFPYSERHTPDPVNIYGMTKFAAEAVVSTFSSDRHGVVRLGKVYTDDTLKDVYKETRSVPTFIKRNFIHLPEFADKIIKIVRIPPKEFPLYKKQYRVLHVGSTNGNWSYDLFYNLMREKKGLPPVEKRNYEIKGMTPRPFRANMNVTSMRKLLNE